MAAVLYGLLYHRRNLRRNRIFRDRTNPLDVYDCADLYKKYRFRRHDILRIVDDVAEDIELSNRGHTVPASMQVLTALRFYATGSFQIVCGDICGISQPTASRIITRVTEALLRHARDWIVFPQQQEADRQKMKFRDAGGMPNVFGCIDGTHIPIQAPKENENAYVNRKDFHSINVQVICNADLIFIDVLARWPGSTHDARMLRTSALFSAFEANPRPLDGVILGDSGYMLREWLVTPLLNPETQRERRFNAAHKATRSAIERAIGVAKKRWHCLRGLRLGPVRACQVITVCLMLSNRARSLNLPEDPRWDYPNNDVDDDNVDDNIEHEAPVQNLPTERARVAAGQATRNATLIASFKFAKTDKKHNLIQH